MMEKPDKFLPALYAGLIMAVVSTVPFLAIINCFCCAGLLLGGFLAVLFYKNNFTPDTPPFTAGDCLAVGALAGVVGAIAAVILSAVIMMMFGNVMMEFIMDLIQSMELDIPEEVMEEIQKRVEESAEGESIFLEFIFNIIIYPIFGLLGGLIGYGVFKPKPAPVQPPSSTV